MAFVLANIELFAAFAAVAALLGLSYSLEGMLGYQPHACRAMRCG